MLMFSLLQGLFHMMCKFGFLCTDHLRLIIFYDFDHPLVREAPG